MTEALTDDEHQAIQLAGQLAGLIGRILGNGRSRYGDNVEMVCHIHALQNMIMAQAAARSYPDRYRLLGEALGDPCE